MCVIPISTHLHMRMPHTHTHTHALIRMFQFFIQNKQMPLVFCSQLISLGIYSLT